MCELKSSAGDRHSRSHIFLNSLSGRECWLDMYGQPSNLTFRWIDGFWRKLDFQSAPTRKGRSLCQYLVDESANDGLTMYAQLSLVWFTDMVLSHRYSASKADANRTLFVCFEELESSQVSIVNHFFPGGHSFECVVNESHHDNAAYGGGHSTSHNAGLRDELKRLLVKIDDRIYRNVLRKMNDELGCAKGRR
jgi:hypothetical protein